MNFDAIRNVYADVQSCSLILSYVASHYNACNIYAFTEGDYQGEHTIILVRVSDDPSREYEFGIASIFYGSCSFCDDEHFLIEKYDGNELEEKLREESKDISVTWYSAEDFLSFLDDMAPTQAWFYSSSKQEIHRHINEAKKAVKDFMLLVSSEREEYSL